MIESETISFRGSKFICVPERIKDTMKEKKWMEFEFKGSKFAIINFEDLVELLRLWKARPEKVKT
jgi:hypothetical protein